MQPMLYEYLFYLRPTVEPSQANAHTEPSTRADTEEGNHGAAQWQDLSELEQ